MILSSLKTYQVLNPHFRVSRHINMEDCKIAEQNHIWINNFIQYHDVIASVEKKFNYHRFRQTLIDSEGNLNMSVEIIDRNPKISNLVYSCESIANVIEFLSYNYCDIEIMVSDDIPNNLNISRSYNLWIRKWIETYYWPSIWDGIPISGETRIQNNKSRISCLKLIMIDTE